MIAAPLVFLVVTQVNAGQVTDKDMTADKVLGAPAAEAPAATAEAMIDAPPPPPPPPWKHTLTVGVNGSMTRSTNVVGTVDGTSATLGAIVEGASNYTHGQHSWENGLKLTESFTRTPTVASFLKSADELRLQSTYYYHLRAVPWLGPYARVLGTTSLFRGYEVRGIDTTIVRNFSDGTSSGPLVKPAQNKYGLTKPFEPTLLRESAGLFANPVTLPAFTLKTRFGGALQHVITRDGFAIKDAAATPEVEYNQLVNATQGGLELGFEMLGKLADNVTYTARADFFLPLFQTDAAAPDGLDSLTTDVAAKLSVRLSTYLSLDYVLMVKRVPVIVDAWQVQNGLLLSCAFTAI